MTVRAARLHAAVAVGLAAAGAVAVLWRPAAPPPAGAPTDLARFAPEVLAAVQAYAGPRRVGALAALLLTVGVPLLAVATGPGRRVVCRLAGGGGWWPARGALVAVAVAAAVDAARSPVAFVVGYVHESRFGFRTGGIGRWLGDWAVANGTGWLLAALGGAGFVALLRRWPDRWRWVLVWSATLATAVVVHLGPLLFEPLWLPTRPLEEGTVRRSVEAVLARAGMEDAVVLVGDASRRTTKANAYVSGLGPSRRVVVYDNLLGLEPDRVAWVVAHEVAHREHRDVARGVLLAATGLLPGVVLLDAVLRSGRVRRWLRPRGPGDPRLVAVGVAFLAVAATVTLPVTNAVSRRAEAAADHRALELTADPGAAVAVHRAFVIRDLVDPRPPGWVVALWGTHPPPAERIRLAVDHARRRDLPLPGLDELAARPDHLRHPRADPG